MFPAIYGGSYHHRRRRGPDAGAYLALAWMAARHGRHKRTVIPGRALFARTRIQRSYALLDSGFGAKARPGMTESE